MLVVLSILLGSVPAPTHAATLPTQPTAAHQAATGIPLRFPLAYRPLSASVSLGDLFPTPQAVPPAFDSPLPTPEPPVEEPAEPATPTAPFDSPLPTPQAQEEPLPGVLLYAITEPPAVALGTGVVCTMTVANEGVEDLADLTLSVTLPAGLAPLER